MRSHFLKTTICGACLCAVVGVASASEPGAGQPSYPTDQGRLDGDKVRLKVNVEPFYVFGQENETNNVRWCATAGSVAKVSHDNGQQLTLRFTHVATEDDKPLTETLSDRAAGRAKAVAVDPTRDGGCSADRRVAEGIQYSVDKKTLQGYDTSFSGVAFGGLVVPFKFYLGGDRSIKASSTIAPYIGVRLPFWFGMTFTPIVSGGLALVPVSGEGDTQTKAALSTAIGLVLTSSKNQSFNAGLVLGKDFLSKSDRGLDKTVDKPWVSFYLGYSM